MSVYLPEKDYDLPDVDLLTLIFDHPLSLTKEDTVVHAEAADPSNCITKAQARAYTKRIAYHLRNSYGVGKNGPGNDVVVCISSGQVLGKCEEATDVECCVRLRRPSSIHDPYPGHLFVSMLTVFVVSAYHTTPQHTEPLAAPSSDCVLTLNDKS
jgi:hypothetical protein